MPNHTPEAVKLDLASITKHITTAGKGNLCQPDDYATIHWTAKVKGSDEIVEDSRKHGSGNPKVFVLGHFDEIKCFDLIVSNMKTGESAEVMCPSKLVYGDHAKFGHFTSVPIPAGSDIVFNIDVLECVESKKKGHVIIAKGSPAAV